MTSYEAIKNNGYLAYYLASLRASIYWKYILNKVFRGEINSWAYRWMLSHWANNGLSIVPAKNLITNVGVGSDATHTQDDNIFLGRKSYPLDLPIKCPATVYSDHKMDNWIEDNFYSKSVLVRFKWLINKLFRN